MRRAKSTAACRKASKPWAKLALTSIGRWAQKALSRASSSGVNPVVPITIGTALVSISSCKARLAAGVEKSIITSQWLFIAASAGRYSMLPPATGVPASFEPGETRAADSSSPGLARTSSTSRVPTRPDAPMMPMRMVFLLNRSRPSAPTFRAARYARPRGRGRSA